MKDSFYTAEQQKVRMRDKKVQSVQEITRILTTARMR